MHHVTRIMSGGGGEGEEGEEEAAERFYLTIHSLHQKNLGQEFKKHPLVAKKGITAE